MPLRNNDILLSGLASENFLLQFFPAGMIRPYDYFLMKCTQAWL